jgi:hypothetical protein
MATRPDQPCLPAAKMTKPFTRASARGRQTSNASRSNRRQASGSRPSVDLAGRSVAISGDIPEIFDEPLAPHHKLIGRWVLAKEAEGCRYSRAQARRRIEQAFDKEVLEILAPFELADMRVVVLAGYDEQPPAIVIVCDSLGQIELGWIEEDNVLRNTLFKQVAPLGWRAAAYKALGETLSCALPIFGYDDLIEEMAAYYWDGEMEDEGARRAMIEWHCVPEEEIEVERLPSGLAGRRADWMLAKNAAPKKQLPKPLRERISRLGELAKSVRDMGEQGNAWLFNTELIHQYVPGAEEWSYLPPMTLVPADIFGGELDDIAQHGMQLGFMDVAGICTLPDASAVEAWFASFRVGVEFLLAAQELIRLDPFKS